MTQCIATARRSDEKFGEARQRFCTAQYVIVVSGEGSVTCGRMLYCYAKAGLGDVRIRGVMQG